MLSSVSTWNHDESWALLPIAVMNAASGLFLKDVLEVRPHDLDFPQAVPLCATCAKFKSIMGLLLIPLLMWIYHLGLLLIIDYILYFNPNHQ